MKSKFTETIRIPHLSTVTIVLLIWASISYNFGAENEGKQENNLNQTQKKPAYIRQINREQFNAAQLGKADGLRVDWHFRLGTPSLIRGAGVGKRGAYSGGKGLGLQGGENYQKDAIAVLDNLSRFYTIRDAEKEFAFKKIHKDTLGIHHVRITQMHHGLRVFGGELIVHFDKNGQAYQVNGQYIPDIQVETVPKITSDQATRVAQEDLAGRAKTKGELKENPVLVIFAYNSAPRLAYEFNLLNNDPGTIPKEWRYWIDAQQGIALLTFENVQRINPPNNGCETTISGNILSGEGGSSVNVTGWMETNDAFYLYNPTWHWEVYDLPDNDYFYGWTYNLGDGYPIEMSAARNIEIVQHYYANVHGRNSYDDQGTQSRINVHAYVPNAAWFPLSQQFYFFDGDGTCYDPWIVLDVCGHEFTHAVAEHSSGLIPDDGDPGALNESFSDILGTCIEFWVQEDGRLSYPGKSPGKADWLIAEDCSKQPLVALRDMRNPHNPLTVGGGGFSILQPSRYQGTYWSEYNDTHQNDGVQNFFFYLLCEGGNGNNDGIVYNVTGIGIENARNIAYLALTEFCTPYTEYRDVPLAWESAAYDLGHEDWAHSIREAWTAVGVIPRFKVTLLPESGASQGQIL